MSRLALFNRANRPDATESAISHDISGINEKTFVEMFFNPGSENGSIV
jgi:hypothetical protein